MIQIKKIVTSDYTKSSFDWVNVVFFFLENIKTFFNVENMRNITSRSVLDSYLM